MSELKARIRTDLNEAMKSRDTLRTNTLRMVLSAILYEEVEGSKHETDDAGVLRIVAREIKKRRESAEIYAANGRQDLADTELAEVAVIEAYQPQQLSDADMEALVAASIEEACGEAEPSMKQMGQVMKVATQKAAGRADGKRLSAAVRAALQAAGS